MLSFQFILRPLSFACLFALMADTRADVIYTEERGEQGLVETTVIRMKVTPAAASEPIFKYRLEAPDIDLQPGNAAPFYYRALAALSDKLDVLRRKYSEDAGLDKWYSTGVDTLPVDELPLDKVRDAVEISTGGIVGDQLQKATTRRECDWDIGMEEIRGIDLISIPLAEFQRGREFTRMLAMRTRLAIAERRYGDAVDTMRTNYRIAHDFASEPFLVSGLVGIAQASLTNGTLIDLMSAPDSPNMYWALAELPRPLVNLRNAARFEMEFGLRMFPFLHNAESTDRSPDEWNRLYTKAVQELSVVGMRGPQNLNAEGAGLVSTALALAGYSHAKAQLIADGMDRDRVEQMSVGQVMAIYTDRTYQRYANEMETIWYVPFSQMAKYDDQVDRRLWAANPFGGSAEREVLPIVSLLLPAVPAARAAQVRMEREMAALQVIEAVRIYASANDGRLPENLDAITQVPIPLNPATGKPFAYRLAGATAILELPDSDGFRNYQFRHHQRRYEIQIADQNQ